MKTPGYLDELPVFFIVGRGRSGSTLLRSLFDAHPHVMIPLESRFVQLLYYKYPSRRSWKPATAQRALRDLEHGFEPPEVKRNSLENQIENLSTELSFQRVCKLVYLNTASEFPKGEIRAVGDKNPRYTFFIPQLIRLFPNARFIHLVRDYRDNIVSVKRAGALINESGNIYFSLGRWILYNRRVIKLQRLFPEKFIRVKFEELIGDPERVMKNLCNFVGLDFDPEILNFHEKVDGYFTNDRFNDLHKSLRTPFDSSKIGEWERELPAKKAIRCEVLAGRLPEKFGYHPEFCVNLLRRTCITLIFYPLVLVGQFRFVLKILFYGWRPVMRMTYWILLKIR